MSMTPEQLQALYAQSQAGQWGVLTPEQIQRQRMEQQWAAAQGAYSNAPGSPTAPNAQYDVWRQQQAVTPPPTGDEQMMTTMDMVTMPDGRQLSRQQALQEGYQQPPRGADLWQPRQALLPVGTGNEQAPAFPTRPPAWTPPPSTGPMTGAPNMWIPGDPVPGQAQPAQADLQRQQMEQQFMAAQGAYGAQRGAPIQQMRGQRNAFSRGARGAGLINQLNAQKDPYAGQNLTDEQRGVAVANDQAVRAYQQKQAPAPAAGAQPPMKNWQTEGPESLARGQASSQMEQANSAIENQMKLKQQQAAPLV